MHEEYRRDRFTISTDPSRVDVDVVHGFLTGSYWAPGIPREIVARSIEHSLSFSLFDDDRQVGFARVVTDRATYAYLCDVFVLDSHRGHGLGVWLMECVMAHPDLHGLRRFMLATRDAHDLYRRFGFEVPSAPETLMEIRRPNIYLDSVQRTES